MIDEVNFFAFARLGAGRLRNAPAIEPEASVRSGSLDLRFGQIRPLTRDHNIFFRIHTKGPKPIAASRCQPCMVQAQHVTEFVAEDIWPKLRIADIDRDEFIPAERGITKRGTEGFTSNASQIAEECVAFEPAPQVDMDPRCLSQVSLDEVAYPGRLRTADGSESRGGFGETLESGRTVPCLQSKFLGYVFEAL